jgi:hypothetical protein
LKSVNSERVQGLDISSKTGLYPGCSSFRPVSRWPYFIDFMDKIDENNIIVGGNDDIIYGYSYIYSKYIAKIFPQGILNRKSFWELLKKNEITNSIIVHMKYVV